MNLFRGQLRASVAPVLAGLMLSACAQAAGNMDNLQGPPVTTEETPYAKKLSCFKEHLPNKSIHIGVAQFRDATGKYNLDEGSGYWITQGATDILYTSFFREDQRHLVERAQTGVLEWEIDMANKKLLGDGESRVVRFRTESGAVKSKKVHYRGISEGGVQGSDYYIVGSVNRLDLTTTSGDVEARVAGIGGSMRGFSMQVGLDMRAVNTRTGTVASTVSLDKRIIGEVYGAGIGRVFGTTLVELGAEVKRVEPLQVALKGMLQEASTQVMADLYGVRIPVACQEPVRRMESEQREEQAARTSDEREERQLASRTEHSR